MLYLKAMIFPAIKTMLLFTEKDEAVIWQNALFDQQMATLTRIIIHLILFLLFDSLDEVGEWVVASGSEGLGGEAV